MNRACKDCEWWHKTPTSITAAQCRGRPPTAILVGVQADGSPIIAAVFPETGQAAWCGEFMEKTSEPDTD